jgi:tRNA 5-methylaminomethyl-2-thiouridine biosynthesis bifunctional protein
MSIASPITPARLEWRGPVPVSTDYGDVYFSLEGGLEETRYVFLDANRLKERFSIATRFVIGELGFGTGLNVMAAWRLWKETAPAQARLHIFSIEKHPLTRDDLARAHAAWPMLAEEAARIQALYPPSLPGFHTLHLDERVTLTLCFGEATEMLRQMRATIDAWFLDGFSPARNDAMWQTELLQEVGRLTRPGGTGATFTAAGAVRQGLQEAGFSVEKREGFGRKRHMICAVKSGGEVVDSKAPEYVIVIGGGVAGVSVARALAEQGARVTLLESSPVLAQGASGTPAAMLFPKLAKQWTPASRFDWSALYHIRRRWVPAKEGAGLLQLPKKQRGIRDEEGWLAMPGLLGVPPEVATALTAREASDKAGLSLSFGGILLHSCALVSLASIVRLIAEHPFIKIKFGAIIERLRFSEGVWYVHVKDEAVLEAPAVVLANGWDAARLIPQAPLPLTPVRGQMTRLPVSDATKSMRLPVGFGGYLSPPDAEGHHWLGATFERGETALQLRVAGHEENISKLREILPAIPASGEYKGWVGVRGTSPDRLPIIGQAINQEGQPLPGLYLSVAHGSRGALSGPLGGEMLAALMGGHALPVEADAAHAFDPLRFAKRAVR